MNERTFKDLLDKYLNNHCTPHERNLVEQWFEHIAHHTPSPQLLSPEEKHQLLENIRASLHLKYANRYVKMLPTRRLIVLASVAATLLMILIWFWVWKRGEFLSPLPKIVMIEKSTVIGETQEIILPDSSVVWLNANSKMHYFSNFSQRREIFLTEGEAFFEVKRDTTHPFWVRTPQRIVVRVLGTSFNVKSYQTLKTVEVSVKMGKVAIEKDRRLLTELFSSQQIKCYQDTFLLSQMLLPQQIGQWKSGEIILNDATLDECSLVLLNQFGVRLITTEEFIQKTKISVNFHHHQSLDEILAVLCLQFGCNYRRVDDDTIQLLPTSTENIKNMN
jgi:transmembrane sensor